MNSVFSSQQNYSPVRLKSQIVVEAGLTELLMNWNLDKEEIGKGAFGTVFLATNKFDPQVRVAVKILDKSTMS